jgi:hypothetical protein
MNNYIVWYQPIWGTFNRYCVRVTAINENHAEIKFYSTKDADNCKNILLIEKV